MVLLSSPRRVDSVDCGSGRDEEPSGGNVLRLIQIRLTRRVWENLRKLVKKILRKRQSLIRVPQTQSVFHPRAQLNAPPSPRCASAIQIVRPFALLQLLACPRQAQPVKVSDREPELGYLLWDFSCAVLLHSSAAKVWRGWRVWRK
jgi:hypothetical protein